DTSLPTFHEVLDSARRASACNDPHIVRVLSVGNDDQAGWIITEIPLGLPLSYRLNSTHFSAKQAQAITGEVASILSTIRKKGLVHLSTSTRNVLLDNDGNIYIDGVAIEAALRGFQSDVHVPHVLDSMEARCLTVFYADLLEENDFVYSLDSNSSTQNEQSRRQLCNSLANKSDYPDATREFFAKESQGTGVHSLSDLIRLLAPWESIDVSALPPIPGDENLQTEAESLADKVRKQSGPVASVKTNIAWPVPHEQQPSHFPTVEMDPSTAVSSYTEEFSTSNAEEDATSTAANTFVSPASSTDRERNRNKEEKHYNVSKMFVLISIVGVVIAGFFSTVLLLTPPDVQANSTSTATPPLNRVPNSENMKAENGKRTDVVSVTLLNPYAGNLGQDTINIQDNPENLGYIADGSTSTVWSSWWYITSTYVNGKDGIGIVLKLAQPTALDNVFIQVNGNGGKVQWRNTNENDPSGGALIAESEMSTATYLIADSAITTDTVILWFPELPKDGKGKNVLTIAEVYFNKQVPESIRNKDNSASEENDKS
ncbi:MAG: hypothetical protein J6M18_03940, partial [Actinomycetaceae bacterium]|nr:hypothetical protein [Actinomycetaceae bacterium]